MKALAQLIVLLLGTIGALYVGIYLMFVGGIVDCVDAVSAYPIESAILAWGLMKFFFASLVGWAIFYFSVLIVAIMEEI